MRYRVMMETGDPGGSGLTETRDFDTFSAADRWREDWILGGWVMTGWEEIARLVHMNVEWVGSDWRGFRVSSMQDAMTQRMNEQRLAEGQMKLDEARRAQETRQGLGALYEQYNQPKQAAYTEYQPQMDSVLAGLKLLLVWLLVMLSSAAVSQLIARSVRRLERGE